MNPWLLVIIGGSGWTGEWWRKMRFDKLPIGATFHFCDDILSRDHIKVSETTAERDGIKMVIPPDYCCWQWFIVFDSASNVYVEHISPYDGDIDMTTEQDLAQFFRGDAWEQFWRGRGCELVMITGKYGEVTQ